jgi:hypothetical protein
LAVASIVSNISPSASRTITVRPVCSAALVFRLTAGSSFVIRRDFQRDH